jgi:hypothetical protein
MPTQGPLVYHPNLAVPPLEGLDIAWDTAAVRVQNAAND